MRRQIWKELFLTLLLAALTKAAYECDDDYTIFGEFCYKANNTEVNPLEALVQCSNEGGMVVSIHSEEENNFVLGLFGESPPALAIIGLFSFSNHFSLWLDATYFNYNGFGLRNLTYGLCVAIAYESDVVNAGQWRNVKCLQSFHPFVCKKDAIFTTEATEAPLTSEATEAPLTSEATEAPLTTPQLDITTQSHTTQSHTTVAHTTQGHSTEPSTTPGPCTVCDPVAFENYDWANADCSFNPLLYFHDAPQIVTNNASNSCTNGFYCDPSLYNTGMTVIRQHGSGKIKCTRKATTAYNNCNDEFSCNPTTGVFGNCKKDQVIATLCAKSNSPITTPPPGCSGCNPVAFEDYGWTNAGCPFNPLLYLHGAPQIINNNGSNSCTNGFYCNPSLYNTGMAVIRQHGSGKIKCTKATTNSYNNCNDEFSCNPTTGIFGNCKKDQVIATLCAKK